jgi:hypothetical protein
MIYVLASFEGEKQPQLTFDPVCDQEVFCKCLGLSVIGVPKGERVDGELVAVVVE